MKLDYEKELYLEPFFEIIYFDVLNVLAYSWEVGEDGGDLGDDWYQEGDL